MLGPRNVRNFNDMRELSAFSMPIAPPLLPELDDIVKGASPQKRADAMLKISGLFREGAGQFRPQHVDLFDGILTGLVLNTDINARAELAAQMADLANAPPMLINKLVRDDEIKIAGPLLRASPLIDEDTLTDIARNKGQPHLLAMSVRASLSPPVTDVILRRGEREVIRSVAGNEGAAFSPIGYSSLVKRAADDGVLAISLGQRSDLSQTHLKQLMNSSVDLVRRRLFEAASPARKAAINQVLDDMPGVEAIETPQRDFNQAQRAILALHRTGRLDEAKVFELAKDYKYDATVAALAMMTGVKISIVDHLMTGDRHDPILIMGKSLDFDWPTVKALIVLRSGVARVPASSTFEEARGNYERLVPVTAQRVLNFWKSRKD